MTNNDILRRVRYIFSFNDAKVIELFALAELQVTREQVSGWLKRDDDPAFTPCNDKTLATFLNGLINDKRGKREGEQPQPESRLTNNLIMMKLRIALNLKAEDILELLSSVGFNLSKHELSAFSRKPDHKHFRECKDQIIRNLLKGMQLKYRGDAGPTVKNHSRTATKTTSTKKQSTSSGFKWPTA
ncbi:DUF1456 family protein [Neiella marina]|uniref:DUF1456 family protein n=1 Tax=Neiella holothuriorum TaxID=2870530 RepID=A0ABS7EK30_9GAMM|nr:DUF1456 family protein [Neiella holothuriorum]MBW8192116.1 DUF1456 family protein [Neiella holothuriorum]